MRIKLNLFIGLLTCFLLAESQAQDFSKVDAHARSVPFPEKQSIQALAESLSEGCTTEKETVRAFFVWIADNISYDFKTYQNKGDRDASQQSPRRVLQSKKGVCEGYSNLFVALCEAAGIIAFQVVGITKDQLGTVSPEGHAWCLVRVDGDWGLIDPTWGAGDVGLKEKHFNEAYFFTSPDVLLTDHYPNDPLFQLLPTPLSWSEFKKPSPIKQPAPNLVSTPQRDLAALKDSLEAFIAMDSFQRLYSIGTRVLQVNPTSNHGLYHLGSYYYQKGSVILTAFSNDYEKYLQSHVPVPTIWCDEQFARLEEAKALFVKSLKILGKMKDKDLYSDTIKVLRNNALLQDHNIKIDISNCKQLCNRH